MERTVWQRRNCTTIRCIIHGSLLGLLLLTGLIAPRTLNAAQLLAGVAKVDITNTKAGPVNDRLFVKALVLKNESTIAAIVTVDAVAIAEIGSIRNDYLSNVRRYLQDELRIHPSQVLINASHCHGVVHPDVQQRTIQAVREALKKLVPVRVGVGRGFENRIMENRRLKLTNGKEVDVRHAYSLPPDEAVAEVGPVDPEIGVLKLEREDGRDLAIVYNFACHPIQGVPNGGNTADITGFASRVIEENLSTGTVAFFLQGCAGDINPVFYKHVDHPRDAEPLGNMLGLSTLRAVRKIKCQTDGRLVMRSRTIALPRADLARRILTMQAEQERLLGSLRGTELNLKSFIPLVIKYRLSSEFPSYYSHGYLHERAMGTSNLTHMDARNRANIKRYIDNILTMERLTRNQTNLALLRKHQAKLLESGKRTIDVELLTVRIGDFVLVTFPGELTVQIGLNLKKSSPHPHTFIAGYTNGYIYYAPTAEQLRNVGGAQEDSDCLLAPAWQALFERHAIELLRDL